MTSATDALASDSAGVLRLEANIFFRTSILSFLLGKVASRFYQREGLSSHEWKVMGVLHRFGTMPASDIAAWVTFDKAAISRAVRRLHERGAIRKTRRAGSARVTDLAFTPSGLASYRRIGRAIAATQEVLFEGMPPAAQAALFATFDTLEQRARAILAASQA
jgi:DNA-binding MarR family transcriptional regulator